MQKLVCLFRWCLMGLLVGSFFSCKQNEPDQKGIDRQSMDLRVEPGVDFYRYACGSWMLNQMIPDSLATYGVYDVLQATQQKRLRNLIIGASENSALVAEQRIASFCRLYKDVEARKREGVAKLKPLLAVWDSTENREQLMRLLVDDLRGFLSWTWMDSVWVIGAPLNAGSSMKESLVANLPAWFEKTGYTDDTSGWRVETLQRVEMRLASFPSPTARLSMKVKEVSKALQGLDLDPFWASLGLTDSSRVLASPGYLWALGAWLKEAREVDLKTYQQALLLCRYAPCLEEDSYKEEGLIRIVKRYMSNELEALYTHRYVSSTMQQDVVKLWDLVRRNFCKDLSQFFWLSDTTRQHAKARVYAIELDFVKAEGSELEPLSATTYWDCLYAFLERAEKEQTAGMQEKASRVWDLHGSYSDADRRLSVSPGFLQAPFFFVGGDLAANFGSLGFLMMKACVESVFGASHSKWWAVIENRVFSAHCEALVRQIDEWTEGQRVLPMGRTSLHDNMTTLLALEFAQRCCERTVKSERKEDLSPTQRFYIAFAQMHAMHVRTSALQQLSVLPGAWKVNALLPNFQAWYEAFHVQSFEPQFLKPEKRVSFFE